LEFPNFCVLLHQQTNKQLEIMKAIANKTIKSSKGIRIAKGNTVELNYRGNKYCDITFNGKSFTTTMGVANSYFSWTF
jgi:hypothetical protein